MNNDCIILLVSTAIIVTLVSVYAGLRGQKQEVDNLIKQNKTMVNKFPQKIVRLHLLSHKLFNPIKVYLPIRE